MATQMKQNTITNNIPAYLAAYSNDNAILPATDEQLQEGIETI